MDTGQRIIVGNQIAEGGFSFIFVAYNNDASTSTNRRSGSNNRLRSKQQQQQQQQQTYALKRIHCPDSELIDQCRYEAHVHRHVMTTNETQQEGGTTTTTKQQQQQQNQYVMPLFGFAIVQNDCYMLFPLCTESLRDLVNRTNPFLQQPQVQSNNYHRSSTVMLSSTTTAKSPISELMVLQIFRQICLGVQRLHHCGYTHRDIKIENVMIVPNTSSSQQQQQSSSSSTTVPPVVPHVVIMDFGSAGPTQVTIHHRKQFLEIVEDASQHTTMPYRPPELFDGGIRLLKSNNSSSDSSSSSNSSSSRSTILNYCAVDVWSLGCTLHAIMYGASPFECEFVSTAAATTSQYPTTSTTTTGTIRIVDCTHLSILGNIPTPKYVPISLWYKETTIREELLLPMLQQEPDQRPNLITILQMVDRMIVEQLGGTLIDMPSIDNNNNSNTRNYNKNNDHHHHHYRDDINKMNDDTDGIALLSRVV